MHESNSDVMVIAARVKICYRKVTQSVSNVFEVLWSHMHCLADTVTDTNRLLANPEQWAVGSEHGDSPYYPY